MATKKYWKGLEELNNSPEFVQNANNEFVEQIPVEEFLGDSNLKTGGTNRRDFLKFLGFSVTAASLAACEAPVNKAIPYVVKPEEITLGVANWYASTYYDGSDYAAVLVKTREGRPIKIAGNSLSKVSLGGTNARIQASVLSLYDSSRLSNPTINQKESNWQTVDKEIIQNLNTISAKGGTIRILSSGIISPSIRAAIAEFTAKYPTTKHIVYDAVSYSSIAKAHSQTHTQEIIPSYNFENADVIVGIGADFIGNWVSDYSIQYGKKRKVTPDNARMSKHYQFESNMSLTGANADERIPVKVSEQGKVALNLYNAITKQLGGNSLQTSTLSCDTEINKVAKELVENKGKSLVVCGLNDLYVQMIVNGINILLDNYGTTIDIQNPSLTRQGNDTAFADLVAEMDAAKVDAIITYNTNPVYTAPAALKFTQNYAKVPLRISFADRADETASLANYICPDHNYLESWNDFNPKEGHYSLSQPSISPLFNTRQAPESLLKWSGNNTSYHSYIQKIWTEQIFSKQKKYLTFTEFWNSSLHDGVFTVSDENIGNTLKVAINDKLDFNEAAQKINAVKGSGLELALYEKTTIGNGALANNPHLQEIPDPITKITWDNYITMSPADMKDKYNLMERQDRSASIVNLTVNGVSIKLPVIPQPGQASGTIGIALGYGREKAGKLSEKCGVVGKNTFPFVQFVNGTLQYNIINGVQIEATSETLEMAGTQVHHTIMGRDLVRETTLREYKSNPKSGNYQHTIVTHSGVKKTTEIDLWNEFDRPGHKWGLTIDLNSCFGCGACVVSCNIENNVAVVGRDQVMNTREMHWLRIDRYYSSDMTKAKAETENVSAKDMYLEMENAAAINPKVVFQPVMCQHCNHAPCETVCPVLATNHSSDGLNMMTYNRCVGTRYCANNCPFKVRRFNWFNYNENSDFTFNPTQDDLGRMVLNPDVVVRSRGVMEKCSMCVQRIQAGKLEAKKASRKLNDGDITIACAEACPTNAIIFGDLNDETSAISKFRNEQADRNYFMLEEFGVKPTVSYLTKVRNSNESFSDGDHEAHKNHGSDKGHQGHEKKQSEEKHPA